MSLILFAAMVGIILLIVKRRGRSLGRTRVDKALSEALEWMKEAKLLNPNIQQDQDVKYRIKEILKKNKVV